MNRRRFHIDRFLRDWRIPHAGPGQSAHVTTGWVGVACPFCPGGDDSFHLGYARSTGAWSCWRCGRHGALDVIMALCGVGWAAAAAIRETYSRGDGKAATGLLERQEAKREPPSELDWPGGTGPLDPAHEAYLRRRGFDPAFLIARYGLLATGPAAPPPYALRIILPVVFEGRTVAWQARDITGRAKAKYLSSPNAHSPRPIKTCLYGYDAARASGVVIVTEGPTDVWRLGPPAVALFGMKHRVEQTALLAQWQRAVLVLDPEPAATAAARGIAKHLAALGRRVDVVELATGRDPGDLRPDEAAALMKELLQCRCVQLDGLPDCY